MTKFTIVMSDHAEKELQELGIKTDSTKSDVVRSSLALFELLLEEAEKGRKLCLKDSSGNYTELVVPAFTIAYNRKKREDGIAPVIPFNIRGVKTGRISTKQINETTPFCSTCASNMCEHIHK